MSANGLRVYVLCGGLLELDLALMLPDRAPGSRWTVPVPAFLVVHGRGRLLFDTGFTARRSRIRWDAWARPSGPVRVAPSRVTGGEPARPPRRPARRRHLGSRTPTFTSTTAAGTNSSRDRRSSSSGRSSRRRATPASWPRSATPRAPRTSIIRSRTGRSTGSTTSSATARSCCSRRTATRPATSPSGCARERAAIWSWPPTPATRGRTWTGISCRACSGTPARWPTRRAAAQLRCWGDHHLLARPSQWRGCRAREPLAVA